MAHPVAAAPSTDAWPALLANVQRARYFLDIHKEAQQGRGTPDKPYLELPRASLVFVIGALDSYLSEVTAEVLVAVLGRGIRTPGEADRIRRVLARVQHDLPTVALELALLPEQTDRAGAARKAIAAYFYDRVSNHGSKAVVEAVQTFDPSANVKAFWNRVAKDDEFVKLVRDLNRRIAKDRSARGGRTKLFPKLQAGVLLDHWTEMRHAIIHRGRDESVWRDEAEACCALVMVIARHLDQLASQPQ